MCGTEVREIVVDRNAAVLGELDAGRSRGRGPSTFGRRPVANITLSAAIVLAARTAATAKPSLGLLDARRPCAR